MLFGRAGTNFLFLWPAGLGLHTELVTRSYQLQTGSHGKTRLSGELNDFNDR